MSTTPQPNISSEIGESTRARQTHPPQGIPRVPAISHTQGIAGTRCSDSTQHATEDEGEGNCQNRGGATDGVQALGAGDCADETWQDRENNRELGLWRCGSSCQEPSLTETGSTLRRRNFFEEGRREQGGSGDGSWGV